MGLSTPWLEDLAVELEQTTTPSDALDAVDSWQHRFDSNDQLEQTIFRTLSRSFMAGQLFVNAFDVGKGRAPEVHLQADPFPRTPFMDMQFSEASQFFLARELMTIEEFHDLTDGHRTEAFAVKRAMSQVVAQRMKDSLQKAVDGGKSLRDFSKEFRNDVTSPLSQRAGESTTAWDKRRSRNQRGYLENVFRTNVAGAYNAGRLTEQMKPHVMESNPYWEYSAVGDARTREPHFELDGKVWKAMDPQALNLYTPNGYNERCTILTVSEGDFEQSQLDRIVSPSLEREAITIGFEGPPKFMKLGEAA